MRRQLDFKEAYQEFQPKILNYLSRLMGPHEAEDITQELGEVKEVSFKRLLTLEEVESRHILEVLEQTGWVIKGEHGAAAILGLPPSTLRYHMKKLGIRRKQGR